MFWGPFWALVAAACSVLVAVGFGRWGWPIVRRAARGVGRFTRGLLAIAELPRALPTLRRFKSLEQKVEGIYNEVHTDGCSSLRDTVNKTRDGVKRTEAALALFVNSTRAQWDGMGLFAVFETDANGMNTYANSTYQRWTLRSEAELLGLGWVNTISYADRQRVRDEWSSCVADMREFVCHYDMRTVRGEEFPVLCTAVPVTAMRHSPVVKWVGVIRRVDEDEEHH